MLSSNEMVDFIFNPTDATLEVPSNLNSQTLTGVCPGPLLRNLLVGRVRFLNADVSLSKKGECAH